MGDLFGATIWPSALKYFGVTLTAVLGVIGTVGDAHDVYEDKLGDRRKRISHAGWCLILGIVASMVVGWWGVQFEEHEKEDAATVAADDRVARLRQTRREFDRLATISSDLDASAIQLGMIGDGIGKSRDTLNLVATTERATLRNLDRATTTLDHVRFPVKGLNVEIEWTIDDTDAALAALDGSDFMRTATGPSHAPPPVVAFFEGLLRDIEMTITVTSDGQTLVWAHSGPGQRPQRCLDPGLLAVRPMHRLSEHKVHAFVTLPACLVRAPAVASLLDFQKRQITAHAAFMGPGSRDLSVRSVRFIETASDMHLDLANKEWPAVSVLDTTLPESVRPRTGKGIYWR